MKKEKSKKTTVKKNTIFNNINKKNIVKNEMNEEILARKIHRYRTINVILLIVLIVILLFAIYRRYDEGIIFSKPELDIGQKKIDDSNNDQDDKVIKDDSSKGEFTLYLVGDSYVAKNGSSSFKVNIRNVNSSNHDIVVRFYISKDELQKHGVFISDNEYLIAESGRFEPGYFIDEVVLKKLPNNKVLPKGKYKLTLSEVYYHHKTGVISSYEAKIPVTLEVLN